MGVVKIKLNTWNRRGNRDTKFKRGVAPREGFIDIDHKTKKVHLKAGSFKWKDWDTSISRYNEKSHTAYYYFSDTICNGRGMYYPNLIIVI